MLDEKECIKSLCEIKNILDDAGIKYWLDEGTLLGAVRDGKFISWDTDIDIGTFYNEARKIIKKVPELEKKGFKVIITDYRIYLYKKSVAIGLCFYRFKKNKAWVLHGVVFPRLFCRLLKYIYLRIERLLYKNLYTEKDLSVKFIFFITPFFALSTIRKFIFKVFILLRTKYYFFSFPSYYVKDFKEIIFYNMNFNIPFYFKDYLKFFYGKNWQIPDPRWKDNLVTMGSCIKTRKKIDYNLFKNYDRSGDSLI
jgi:lipopolysaccharide cholinephosphotransferase